MGLFEKCELGACAGALPLLKGDWTYCRCPEVYRSDVSEKRMDLLRRAQHWFLSWRDRGLVLERFGQQ